MSWELLALQKTGKSSQLWERKQRRWCLKLNSVPAPQEQGKTRCFPEAFCHVGNKHAFQLGGKAQPPNVLCTCQGNRCCLGQLHTQQASMPEGASRCTEGPAFKVCGCCSHNPILFPTTLLSARCTAGISSAVPSSCSRNRGCFSPGNVLQEEWVQQHQARCLSTLLSGIKIRVDPRLVKLTGLPRYFEQVRYRTQRKKKKT